MRTVGIIAEYNPFHTGHAYHIQKAKEMTGADFSVIVMSPDFVQRGEPAAFDKYSRTRMALSCGADLVLELPVCYATGSAEYFAEGAVSMLHALGTIDALCFGAETDDSEIFLTTANFLNHEPDDYRNNIRILLAEGKTFPQARATALARFLPQKDLSFLNTPNNILGLEYCRVLNRMSLSITPIPIKRKNSNYHSTSLEGSFCSASAIRQALMLGDYPSIEPFIPKNCIELFQKCFSNTVNADDLLPFLHHELLSQTTFSHILDIGEDLSDRILKERFHCIGHSYQEISSILKTRQFTHSRIRRALLHLILDIRQEDIESFRANGTVFYSRILGFRKSSSALLHEMKKKTQIPLINRPSQANALLNSLGTQMWEKDLYASHLYRTILNSKYIDKKSSFRTEYEMSPVIL